MEIITRLYDVLYEVVPIVLHGNLEVKIVQLRFIEFVNIL